MAWFQNANFREPRHTRHADHVFAEHDIECIIRECKGFRSVKRSKQTIGCRSQSASMRAVGFVKLAIAALFRVSITFTVLTTLRGEVRHDDEITLLYNLSHNVSQISYPHPAAA